MAYVADETAGTWVGGARADTNVCMFVVGLS